MRRIAAAIAGAALLGTGCYHTTYRNLHGSAEPPRPESELEMPGYFDGWRHFFLMGLAPLEKPVHAENECGERSLAEIHTGQNAVQGVLTFASGIITMFSIYAPYVANPICTRAAGS